jgi:hypothetical protein
MNSTAYIGVYKDLAITHINLEGKANIDNSQRKINELC